MEKNISYADAVKVYTAIMGHHSFANITKMQAQMFYSELADWLTFDLAMEAVRRFYAENHEGRWMMSGDVNYIAKQIMHERTPEQNEIENAMLDAVSDKDSDNPMKYITAKRAYIKARQLGATVEQATVSARGEASKVKAYIEPTKPRKATHVRHFIGDGRIGDMSLADIVGKN